MANRIENIKAGLIKRRERVYEEYLTILESDHAVKDMRADELLAELQSIDQHLVILK